MKKKMKKKSQIYIQDVRRAEGRRTSQFFVPIKIIERIKKDSYLREHIKNTALFGLIGILILSQIPILSAFEAHIINVTAKICNYSQTRTMGFWKNHEEIYFWLLPLYVGDVYLVDEAGVDLVFDNAKAKIMEDMLRGQLLAMKFNVAYFGIGGYYIEPYGGTIDDLVLEADNMLISPGNYTRDEMEHIKILLDSLNNMHYLSYCSGVSPVIPENIVLFNSAESESLLLEPMSEVIEVIETATPSEPEGPGNSEESSEGELEPLPDVAPQDGAEAGEPEPPLESSGEDLTGQTEPEPLPEPEPEPELEPQPEPEPEPEPIIE